MITLEFKCPRYLPNRKISTFPLFQKLSKCPENHKFWVWGSQKGGSDPTWLFSVFLEDLPDKSFLSDVQWIRPSLWKLLPWCQKAENCIGNVSMCNAADAIQYLSYICLSNIKAFDVQKIKCSIIKGRRATHKMMQKVKTSKLNRRKHVKPAWCCLLVQHCTENLNDQR